MLGNLDFCCCLFFNALKRAMPFWMFNFGFLYFVYFKGFQEGFAVLNVTHQPRIWRQYKFFGRFRRLADRVLRLYFTRH
jgi:hypothetical protein